jgi:hypothetical protein
MEILQGMTDMLHNQQGKSKVEKPAAASRFESSKDCEQRVSRNTLPYMNIFQPGEKSKGRPNRFGLPFLRSRRRQVSQPFCG